jgi:peptidase E
MNAKMTISALLLAAFAGSALADDPTVVNERFVSGMSRAEVLADLQAYKATGVNPWANSYQPLKYFHSDKTRADVVAEYLASRNEVSALTSEDSGSAYLAQARGIAQPVSTFAGTPVNAQ